MKLVHISLYTHYSFVQGLILPESLFAHPNINQFDTICLTDTNNLFAAAEAARLASQHNIKLIYGSTILLRSDNNLSKIILYAKTILGYRSLSQLLSYGFKNLPRWHGMPIYNLQHLQDMQDVICVSGGMFGQLGRSLLYQGLDEGQIICDQYLSYFKDNFMIDIQRCFSQQDPREEIYNQRAIYLANKNGVPILANNYVCFLNEEDFQYHNTKVATNTKNMLYGAMLSTYSKEMYLKSGQQMYDLFVDYPEAIQNTRYLAQQCNVYLPTDYIPLFTKSVLSDQKLDVVQELNNMIDLGVKKRLNNLSEQQIQNEYIPRLQKEKHVIYSRDYAHYFLIVAQLSQWVASNKIPKGPGRGSSASSLIAYLLGITDIDPVQYKLVFERFMNLESESLPDIDIDFCINKREQVIDYLKQQYGYDHVAQIIAYGYLGLKSGIKDLCRVLGYNYADSDKLSKLVPFGVTSLDEALQSPAFAQAMQSGFNQILIDQCRNLEHHFRSASRHAAGVVIVPNKLEHLGIYYPEDDSEHAVIQWNMYNLAPLGILKLDCLGLRTLTSVQKILEDIEHTTSKKLDISQIHEHYDETTYRMLRAGTTDGVFQLESMGMQSFLTKCHIENFADITAMIALNRPGPMNSGMLASYIQLRNYQTPIKSIHPLIDDILQETFGLIVYQEQIMLIVDRFGIDLSQGVNLQKAISKKDNKYIEDFKRLFVQKGQIKQINPEVTHEIFEVIRSFGAYGFNKAHATAYAVLTYRCAYLKAHYLAHFYRALLSSDTLTDKVSKYIISAIQEGIKILNPCINKGDWEYTYIDDHTLRCGFKQIKGINHEVCTRLIKLRLDQPYTSLYDFIKRVFGQRVGLKACSSLISAGAMDCLQQPRTYLLGNLEHTFKQVHYDIKLESNPQTKSRPINHQLLEPWIDYIPYNYEQIINQEIQSLSICLSRSPLSLHKHWLNRLNIVVPGCEPYGDRHNYAGFVCDIMTTRVGSTLKVLCDDNKGLIYMRSNGILDPDIGIGSIVISNGCKAYYNQFYNQLFTRCNKIKSLRSMVNARVNKIILKVENDKLQHLHNALAHLIAENNTKTPESDFTLLIEIADSNKIHHKLIRALKISAYDVYISLIGLGNIAYLTKS